jgi:hypothetical protein
MAHQVTHMVYLDDLDALCRGQPDLYAVAVSGAHLVHCRDQHAGPCADAISDALPHQQIGQQIHGHFAARNQSQGHDQG